MLRCALCGADCSSGQRFENSHDGWVVCSTCTRAVQMGISMDNLDECLECGFRFSAGNSKWFYADKENAQCPACGLALNDINLRLARCRTGFVGGGDYNPLAIQQLAEHILEKDLLETDPRFPELVRFAASMKQGLSYHAKNIKRLMKQRGLR